jgi:hypothetical protein
MDNIFNKLNYDRQYLICFAIINGNDYDKIGIPNIGLKKSISLLNEIQNNLIEKSKLIEIFKLILTNSNFYHLLKSNFTLHYYDKFNFNIKCSNLSLNYLKLQIINEYINFDEDECLVLIENIQTKMHWYKPDLLKFIVI